MQLKWLEDLLALAQERSVTRAAERRHVTHPAFGRRLRALEDWAGVPLWVPGSTPLRLTPAGEALLLRARDLVDGVQLAQRELRRSGRPGVHRLTLATGRTLARTLVADRLPKLLPLLAAHEAELDLRTASLAETAEMLQADAVDLLLVYHHPSLALPLSPRRTLHCTVAHDRLLPVSRCDARGRRQHDFRPGRPVPLLAYAPTLALGRLLDDHLAQHPQAPALHRVLVCDSADALLEYVLKGVGVAWLPASLAAAARASGQLAVLGDDALAVPFEVRLLRAKRRATPLVEAAWALLTADATDTAHTAPPRRR